MPNTRQHGAVGSCIIMMHDVSQLLPLQLPPCKFECTYDLVADCKKHGVGVLSATETRMLTAHFLYEPLIHFTTAYTIRSLVEESLLLFNDVNSSYYIALNGMIAEE
jgi:hypothetical protein